MGTKHLAIGAGLAVLGLVTPPPAAAEDGRLDVSRGARLYSQVCGRCHNPRAPTELDDRFWPVAITHMRVVGQIPGDQARAILAFLMASNNPPRRDTSAERPAPSVLSEAQLLDRSGCRGCHVIDGTGGAVGPSLDDLFQRRDVDWVRVQIRDPRAHNPTTVMPDFDFSEAEVDAIVEALRGRAAEH